MPNAATDKSHWVPLDYQAGARVDLKEPAIALALCTLMVTILSGPISPWAAWCSRIAAALALAGLVGMLWVYMGKTLPDAKYSLRKAFRFWRRPLKTLALARRMFYISLPFACASFLYWLVLQSN
jgi:hypothetical protein